MNTNILPLGTAIKIKSAQALIAGYRLIEDGSHLDLCYVLLPLPYGYRHADDLKVISVSDASGFQVIEMGFNSAISQANATILNAFLQLGEKISMEELNKMLSGPLQREEVE